MTTYSLHPGAIDTDLIRHIPVVNNPILRTIFKPLAWPFIKDRWHGAQTQVCCAVDDKLKEETGKYYAYVLAYSLLIIPDNY